MKKEIKSILFFTAVLTLDRYVRRGAADGMKGTMTEESRGYGSMENDVKAADGTKGIWLRGVCEEEGSCILRASCVRE